MRPVRLPRLRCALLGLLPLWARDGAGRTSLTKPIVESGALTERSKGKWANFTQK